MNLIAHPDYWDIPEDLRKAWRCGAGQGLAEKLVPDNILGLNIQPACSIHDFDWGRGKDDNDFQLSNVRFLANLFLLIAEGMWLLRLPRRELALGYYNAVQGPVGKAIWDKLRKRQS